MHEVESILNARPLTKVSDDPPDLNALRPNHVSQLGILEQSEGYGRRGWKLKYMRIFSNEDGYFSIYLSYIYNCFETLFDKKILTSL